MRTGTVIFSFFFTLLSGSSAYADVVTDWNSAALDAIRLGKASPPVASRALAMLHVAIYDAVNGISRTHETYRVASAVPRSASEDAAAAAAAHTVLVALFPSRSAAFDALYVANLAAIPDGPHKEAGVSWGQRVGAEILLWRSNDNSDVTIAPPVGGTTGSWQQTSSVPYLLPQWAFVAAFAIPNGGSRAKMMIRMPIVFPATAALPKPVRIRMSPIHDEVPMKFWNMPTPDRRTIPFITAGSSRRSVARTRIRLRPVAR